MHAENLAAVVYFKQSLKNGMFTYLAANALPHHDGCVHGTPLSLVRNQILRQRLGTFSECNKVKWAATNLLPPNWTSHVFVGLCTLSLDCFKMRRL